PRAGRLPPATTCWRLAPPLELPSCEPASARATPDASLDHPQHDVALAFESKFVSTAQLHPPADRPFSQEQLAWARLELHPWLRPHRDGTRLQAQRPQR